jgi:phosphoribosylanthranilate isomerase
MSVHVKVCGVTTIDDARGCVAAGVSAIGLNFVPASPRCLSIEEARAIVSAIAPTKVMTVGVVADLPLEELVVLRDATGIDCLQLHGDEPAELLVALGPHAYKAVRIGTAEDVARASSYPGDHILVDAKVEGVLGGSGVRVDPALVAPLARTRKLTLAGGLEPGNVAAAVAIVRPFAVDVASGVEHKGQPRRKDLDAVAAFVAAARRPL